MICEKCSTNQANVQLRVQLNGSIQDFHLCSDCYKEERAKLHSAMNGYNGAGQSPKRDKKEERPEQAQKEAGLLGEYGRNLTNLAKAGLIDPVIGRDAEISQMIEILNRRNKNNPVLIGEPGIGKTAAAEGLALKIADGTVPQKLKGKEVILLDVASLVSNTGIRGQFEERMKQLVSEVQSRKNVILFIDEIHQIVGAGSAEGSMDAGNILKPALARGELQLVGATTLKEYRKIEKDAALERRFQPIHLKEPTAEEAFEILKGLAPRYEEYHKVTYSEEALKGAVQLSKRYIQDRFLPDKAIDLMDEAGSKLNLTVDHHDKEEIQQRLKHIHLEKEKALKEENYELAAKLRDEEEALEHKQNDSSSAEYPVVDLELIQKLIERKTGIPVGKLEQDERVKMSNLEENLNNKVIGQYEAVKKVAKAVRRSRAGLKSKNRPAGSFLFVGPTGVGKTELSKTLAEELFGSRDQMIRLDMSEYMEKHSVSKLIGSPPGYVGHDEAGQLTEKVRRNPYSILLLDEIEKAHPDVMNMFLQIMEDGRLTDSQGRTVQFKDTVIIMTSNAGVGMRKKAVGFGATEAADEATILDSLSNFFKPEFLNRFDSIIEFKPLEKAHLVKIVDLMLEELNELIEEQGMELTVSKEVKEQLAELGYHPSFGARPLRRVIQEYVEDRITDFMYDNPDLKNVRAELIENEVTIVSK
ncbi:ATP-dependent Clp protease ATP-binding subunit [Jeotgalibacillus sp. R-1-5s-1]|uniref:ATP-dependent Clp protease ATP-binding subunit n=1 Tax=Jeotgalibacillus sp. R-1-5s-1 TaxID=2555897 RepID=UPI00106A273A|nr:ATP-dependent Clp protease ATP-binding subunit [Jeotgalibacillus sp. R-1-5s-1]TFE03681.1 ATP-dependent Clp protease ATP-binding subunit [Jeotgalibacillus sp. R-1-5s-1]